MVAPVTSMMPIRCLVILIFSLTLYRCTVTELSVCLSGLLCTHLRFLVLAMMSILLAFVLSRMPSRQFLVIHESNTQQWYVVFTALRFKLVYGMYVICRRVLAPTFCLFSRLIFI